jgi:hypothetical protein
MLKAKGMPNRFWGEAVLTAVYILNRSLTRALDGKTPYEAWQGHRPAVEHLRAFSCVVHAKITKPDLKKLDDRSAKTIFIGYEPGSKAYRLYNPVADRVIISRDVVFDEATAWDWSGEHRSVDDKPLIVEYMAYRGVPVGNATSTSHGQASGTPGPASTTGPGGSLAAQGTSPARSTSGIKFATPPSSAGATLDAEDDPAAPHRFRLVSDLLDEAAGEADEDENLYFIGEPSNFDEAEPHE